MAKLQDKVKTALNESRMLILGSQILLGFQFRSTFEKTFDQLSSLAQYLEFGGLALMVIAIAMLMSPGAYHQIVDKGEDTHRVLRFTTTITDFALLPFAVVIGIDLFVVTERLAGRTSGVVAGVVTTASALFFWYGFEFIHKRKRYPIIKEMQKVEEQSEARDAGTKLKDKIDHVLSEDRVVLPGAQALLGFQFASMLMEGFDKLPTSSKYVHLTSLALVAFSIILLMAPAAYHRIVEQGENTQHFHRFASRVLLSAMGPLALGIAGDFYIVALKVTKSAPFSIFISLGILLVCYGLWFGYTLYVRSRDYEDPAWAEEYAARATKP